MGGGKRPGNGRVVEDFKKGAVKCGLLETSESYVLHCLLLKLARRAIVSGSANRSVSGGGERIRETKTKSNGCQEKGIFRRNRKRSKW